MYPANNRPNGRNAKQLFFEPDECVMQLHPPKGLRQQSSILLTFGARDNPYQCHPNSWFEESITNRQTDQLCPDIGGGVGHRDNYDWPAIASTWTREEVAELIQELLQKREGRRGGR